MILSATLIFGFYAASASSPSWTYEGALKCIHAFTEVVPADKAPVPFSKGATPIGIIRGGYKDKNGFFLLTEKAPYFIAQEESAKSAGEGGDESKITVTFPADVSHPIKFFYKTSDPSSGIHFTEPNEFDRKVAAQEAAPESAKGVLNEALRKLWPEVRNQAKPKPVQVRQALAHCEETDFQMSLPNAKGIESTLRDEMAKTKKLVQPSVFSKEYWLPKKDGAG